MTELNDNCDDEWSLFCSDELNENSNYNKNNIINTNNENEKQQMQLSNSGENIPTCSDIYISTKTKIGYFDKPIDFENIFWKIPIISYQEISTGVIKKQIKISTSDDKYIDYINNYLKNSKPGSLDDLSKNKAIKFTKKITIGISKKDLISYRCKKKGAFYNCFVLIFRIKYQDIFKEMHVKFFNTGKIEIPGIKKDEILDILLKDILNLFRNQLNIDIDIKKNSFNTILINSNFNSGYYINRDKLTHILKYKYELCTSYDPCSYPGIMSKIYYTDEKNIINSIKTANNNIKDSTTKKVISFMVFRTGSVLIVGKCNENILNEIYNYLKSILVDEYFNIHQKYTVKTDNNKKKRKKIKRQYITKYV